MAEKNGMSRRNALFALAGVTTFTVARQVKATPVEEVVPELKPAVPSALSKTWGPEGLNSGQSSNPYPGYCPG